jgi:hypothetical protein
VREEPHRLRGRLPLASRSAFSNAERSAFVMSAAANLFHASLVFANRPADSITIEEEYPLVGIEKHLFARASAVHEVAADESAGIEFGPLIRSKPRACACCF